MADDFITDPGSGGSTFAADDIDDVLYPRTKLVIGDDGTNDGDISALNPLPVIEALLEDCIEITPGGGSSKQLQIDLVNVIGAPGSPSGTLVGIQGHASMTAVTVSGTITANAGTNLNTSTLATAANQTTELASLASIDGKITAVNTGAVVVSSSALPSGAATVAKQPALGTAGTPAADVISVQGVASMTALKVDGSAVTQPVSGTVSITANSSVNLTQVGGSSTATGHGTASGAIRVELPTDGTGVVSAAQSGTWNIATVTTVTTVGAVTAISNALPAGNNNIGDVDVASIAAGNNNIGDVDIASIAAGDNNIGNVDIVTLPALVAGTAIIGKVINAQDTSNLYNGTTALTPAFATIDTATSGDVTVVDPGGGKKVRVLAMSLIGTGTAVNIYFKTGSTGKVGSSSRPIVIDKTGATGAAGFVMPYNPVGWFEGAADENLTINLSTAQGVVGNVTYVEI